MDCTACTAIVICHRDLCMEAFMEMKSAVSPSIQEKKKLTSTLYVSSNGLETVISQSNLFIIQTQILILEHTDASCGL